MTSESPVRVRCIERVSLNRRARVDASIRRLWECWGSKDGFHSFTSGFLFAHALSCQTLGCKHSCLFIYYFATIRIQWWLLKTFILLFQWRQSSSKVVGALRGLARVRGLSFGWEAPTNLSKAQGRQLWPFGAVCMGCIKPNDVCLGFSNFFFFLALINTFSCLFSDHLLLSCVCCSFLPTIAEMNE